MAKNKTVTPAVVRAQVGRAARDGLGRASDRCRGRAGRRHRCELVDDGIRRAHPGSATSAVAASLALLVRSAIRRRYLRPAVSSAAGAALQCARRRLTVLPSAALCGAATDPRIPTHAPSSSAPPRPLRRRRGCETRYHETSVSRAIPRCPGSLLRAVAATQSNPPC